MISETAIGRRTSGVSSLPRAGAYGRLAGTWAFPDSTFHSLVRSDAWKDGTASIIDGLPYRVRSSGLRWCVPESHEELQSEYIRLFQIGGRRGPPCSLHSGFYERDRGRTLQRLIRFYNFFGLGLNNCVMPDQLTVELEFMARLARGGVSDPESELRAQRDFLRGYLGWVTEFAERVRSCRPLPFYAALTALTARLVQADRQFIDDLVLSGGSYDQD